MKEKTLQSPRPPKQNIREWRCDCGRLLFKGEFLVGIIEAKCPRCKSIVYLQECNTFTTGAHSFMVLVDPSGIVMSATARIKEVLGFEPEEVVGINLEDVIDESSSRPVAFWLKKVFDISQTSTPSLVSALNIINKNGECVPLTFFAKATDLKGRPLVFAIVDAGEDALERFSKRYGLDSGSNREYQYAIWDFRVNTEGKIVEVSKENQVSATDDAVGKDLIEVLGGNPGFSQEDFAKAVKSGMSAVLDATLTIDGEAKSCSVSLTTNILSIADKDSYIVSISVN